MKRPTLDEYMLQILDVVKTRATCPRRQVGAVITDEKGHILATGYNGVPSGFTHCTDSPCAGSTDSSGDTSRCIAIHAETNAILQAGDRINRATRIYCSASPCFGCAKLLAGTGIKTVVTKSIYPDQNALELMSQACIRIMLAKYDGNQLIAIEEYEPA